MAGLDIARWSQFQARDMGRRGGLWSGKAHYLLATVGDRDGPASLDPVEKPLLDRVVVEGPCKDPLL